MTREDLEKLGLTKEQVDKVCDLNNADVQPLKNDLQKAKDDLEAANEKVSTTEEALKKFNGVDPTALNKQITDLQEDLKKKDAEHAAALADRDFNDLLRESIAAAKGKNAKAITALLDIDVLKASKNQKEDVATALKALAEAEDSKMLFGETETITGKGNPIGNVTKNNPPSSDTLKSAIAEHYNAK